MPRKKTRASNYIPINGSFLQLPHKTILSPEFNDLSYSARAIYLVLLTKWNREKDKAAKEYAFPYVQLLESMKDSKGKKPSKRTISLCLQELQDKDFIAITYGGRNNPSTYKVISKWLQ